MLEDIWNSIRWIGLPGALFVAFIIFCLIKGGNNKGGDGNSSNGSSNNNNNNAQL